MLRTRHPAHRLGRVASIAAQPSQATIRDAHDRQLCHRSYQHEAANDALEGLLLSPVDRGAVYLGKAAAAFVQLFVLLVVTTGIVIVPFGLPVGPAPALLLLTGALGVRRRGH